MLLYPSKHAAPRLIFLFTCANRQPSQHVLNPGIPIRPVVIAGTFRICEIQPRLPTSIAERQVISVQEVFRTAALIQLRQISSPVALSLEERE